MQAQRHFKKRKICSHIIEYIEHSDGPLAAIPRHGVHWIRTDGSNNQNKEKMMPAHRIFSMAFAKVYPLYVQKAERKGRSKEEVDEVICWLTGYDNAGLQRQIEQECDFETFFAQAPAMHPNRALVTGLVCGIRVEDVEDPLMQKIRQLDKLIDELARGKAMANILRQSP